VDRVERFDASVVLCFADGRRLHLDDDAAVNPIVAAQVCHDIGRVVAFTELARLDGVFQRSLERRDCLDEARRVETPFVAAEDDTQDE
jgi:hypothetical protein